jgi:hypothetical protein
MWRRSRRSKAARKAAYPHPDGFSSGDGDGRMAQGNGAPDWAAPAPTEPKKGSS